MMAYSVKMPEAWARMKWCEQTFGPQSLDVWWRDRGWLCFAKPQYRTLYLLRWA